MVMLPQDACAISEETCCGDLFAIAEHLLTNVHEALLECYTDMPCPLEELNAYVTMGNGDDAILDALTVAFTVVQASPGSSRNGVQLPVTLQRATFNVRLRESGWPMVRIEGGTITPPSPQLQNAVARHAYGHGEKMHRTLLSMKARRCIVPDAVRGCQNASVGTLTPLSPTAGVIGFLVPVIVDLPWMGG